MIHRRYVSHQLPSLSQKTKKELTSYFGDIDNDDFTDYLHSKLKHIDLEIPLENGNIKRNNSRDEDN